MSITIYRFVLPQWQTCSLYKRCIQIIAIFYVFMKTLIVMWQKKASSLVLVFQVTPGSKASRVNLCPGDIILAIQGASTDVMTHAEAQNKIKDSTNQLFLKIERYRELFSLKDSVTNSVKHLSTTLYQVLSPPFKVEARGRTVSWGSKWIFILSRLQWKCPSVPTEPYLRQWWICLSSVINALP